VLEIKNNIYVLPFRIYGLRRIIDYPQQTKQGCLYKRYQATYVDPLPTALRTHNVCAHDAHLTLNFIPGLVCHSELIQHCKIFTMVYNIQIQSFSLELYPVCHRCTKTKHYVSEAGSNSVFRKEAPNMFGLLRPSYFLSLSLLVFLNLHQNRESPRRKSDLYASTTKLSYQSLCCSF